VFDPEEHPFTIDTMNGTGRDRAQRGRMVEGSQIGGYRLLRQIGEGGMGTVWMAEHSMLGRRAAIKILHDQFSGKRSIVSRFFNEARAATAISDPGIIQIFDFGIHSDGSAYIVMELLDGETLDQRLRRQGTLLVSEALRIGRQAASAVGAAHARGIIHRDLKPDNIFIVRDSEVAGGERAKVLDFGIAKLTEDLGGPQKTSESVVMGTPTYMSPEQCRGASRVDARSDVYSLGCVLYTAVTGYPPFRAKGSGEMMMQHMIEAAPAPSTLAKDLPAEIDGLIMRCLRKEPAERFASGAELAAAIDALLGKSPSAVSASDRPAPTIVVHNDATTLGASAASLVSPSTTAPLGRRGKLVAGLAAASVAVATAVALLAWRGAEDPEPAPPPSPRVAETPSTPTPTTTAVDPRPAQVRTDMRALLTVFLRWAVDHKGAPCPTSGELGARLDPWGHAYELTCTDQPADQIVGLRSLGPDGARGTSDDLTSWTLDPELAEIVPGPRWASAPAAVAPAPTPVAADTSPTDKGSAATPIKKPPIKKPPVKKPKVPAAAGTQPPDGIVDLDGDGIPDQR
jgi:serine/threonine-protein kinase